MLRSLGSLIDRALGVASGEDPAAEHHALQLATAVLLVEIARADYAEDQVEDQKIVELLTAHFELSEDEIGLLVHEAKSEADHSASLQEFTRRLHEALTLEEKLKIVEMLWRVALADAYLDKHEDHLVRKIAGLLYVSHSDLIRIRNEVRRTAE